jgi:hypothetical protein
MKKVAVFVEGQTELIFAGELIKQIFGHNNVTIEEREFSGPNGLRLVKTIQSVSATPSTQYFFRIYDCHGGGDESTVKSDINEQFQRLENESFSYIVGIRDVYPALNLGKLKSMLSSGLSTKPTLPAKIFLAVREIEAWFLAEEYHYLVIDASLTVPRVNAIVGFDITTASTETIVQPSLTLKKVYQSVGKTYNKRKKIVNRTVTALDYENLYLAVRNRNSSLDELLTCLDGLIP